MGFLMCSADSRAPVMNVPLQGAGDSDNYVMMVLRKRKRPFRRRGAIVTQGNAPRRAQWHGRGDRGAFVEEPIELVLAQIGTGIRQRHFQSLPPSRASQQQSFVHRQWKRTVAAPRRTWYSVMFDVRCQMRTTLAIDDDVLGAAKKLADQQHRSLGAVISDLARQALRRPAKGGERNGIPLLTPRSDTLVTLDTVNALRDEIA